MTKRQKFVGSSLILSAGLLTLHLLSVSIQYEFITAISLAALILAAWSLRDGLRFNATLLTLVLPVLFTFGASFFYFYLFVRSSFIISLHQLILSALSIIYWLSYAVGMYASLLGSNIYTVAAIRTIALLRTAQAVGFLLTVVTAFFLFDTVFSFRSFPWVNGLAVLFISFPLSLQALWSIELEEKISWTVLVFASVISIAMGEIALMISFWPVTVTVGSLFLTTILYILLGITQTNLQGRLFVKTLKEYLFVGLVVFAAVYFSAKWGG